MRAALSRSEVALLPLLLLFVALSLWFPEHPSDERSYLELAHDLTHGAYTGLGWRPANPFPSPDPDKPDLWFGPGLPLAITPLVAVGLPVEIVRLTGPVFLFLAVLVFFRLLRLCVARPLALLGGYALGLYFPFYVLLSNLHSEPLAILGIVGMLYLLARYLGTGQLRYGLLAGCAASAVALTRVEYGWVITLMLLAFLMSWLVTGRRAFGQFAVVYAVALALCVPWLAYTHSVTGRAFLWGNSGSLSLYWMSSPYEQDLGDWRGGAYEIVYSDPLLAHHRSFFRKLARLDPVEQNRRLERAAFENIRVHPRKFVENVAANVSRMWFDLPFSAKQEELKLLFYALPNSVVLWALVASSIVLARRRAQLPPESIGFVTFGALAFVLHSALAAYPRMLMPIIPIALWVIFYCAGAWTDRSSHASTPVNSRRTGEARASRPREIGNV